MPPACFMHFRNWGVWHISPLPNSLWNTLHHMKQTKITNQRLKSEVNKNEIRGGIQPEALNKVYYVIHRGAVNKD